MDLDGSEAYSQSIELTQIQQEQSLRKVFFDESGILQLGIYPTTDGFTRITCTDMQGRVAGIWTGDLKTGASTLTIDATGWAAGMYVVQMMQNGYSQTAKVIKY